MVRFIKGFVVLFVFTVTICNNSAEVTTSEPDVEQIIVGLQKGEGELLESNEERAASVDSSDKDAVSDIVAVTTQDIKLEGNDATKNELIENAGGLSGGEENSISGYDQAVSDVLEVTKTDNRENAETITDQWEEEITTKGTLNENKISITTTASQAEHDLNAGTNKTRVNSELMSSEVQVEDFMKSRVAYHDAISADVNESINISSHTLFTNSEVLENEPLSAPEKLTMEETIGDLWKENPDKDKLKSTLLNKNVINSDDNEFYNKPEAFKLVTKNRNQFKEKETENFTTEKEIESSSNYDTTETFLITPTDSGPSTKYFEKNVSNFGNYSESNTSNETSTNSSVTYSSQNRSEGITSNFKSETVKQILNFGEATPIIAVNDPVAERLYDFGPNKEHNMNTFNNIEDRSVKKGKLMDPQSFRDYKDLSEEDLIEIQNLLPDHPRFEKEKIEPGVLFEDCIDCDFRVLPIRPAEQRDAPKMEEESLTSPTIRFPDLPEGRELQIYTLGLSDGFFLFGYLSEFLSWIQPNEFPVELLRDALRSQITWISLITQSLQVEAGFVACLVVGVLLALAVPVVVLSHACYRMTSREDDDVDGKVGWTGNCRRRTLVFILQILLVLLLVGMVAMFVTNEQLSDSVVKSSDVIQTSLSDVSAFVHNSHLQLHFLVTQSLDQALQAIYADLDNVDSLLGRPIQRELVRETGIDVALESLTDLTREAKQTTQQVDRLLDEVRVVQEMVISTRDKMSDLRQQVELFRRACGPRDRALCDTIDASGLDVTLRLDRLKSDDRLHRMRRMGGVGLETATAEAKERFMAVPSKVDTDTRDAREAARRQLMRQRADVDDRSLALERLVRDMTSKVNEAKYQAGFWMQDLDQFEYWRWIVCMGGGAAVLMVWTMLLCSLCCGCCGSEKAAGPTILVTIVLVCLLSTALWSVALVGMMFGGHGEVFVCRPLYDEPEYHVISRLVDQPGVFYSEPRGGFIANVIYGNDTLDVPIRQVLEECRQNRGIYPTLGLGRVFDVEAAVDQHRWMSVSMQLRSVRANLSSLEVLSPALQDQLSSLLASLSVNFTEHRIQMSRPVTGKDMDSFARQLDNIGNQMRDLAVASRMETLSTRTRRLIDSHIKPLESRKDALVYQLTALEVQTGPLQRQVNQSLSHLKTIQFFINSQGEAIAQRKSRQYVDRLMNYVEQLRRHVADSISSSVAPCRPLWDIFNTTRLFLCRHTMDPLNGYWFASMWCLIILLMATPVCLKLVDYYRAKGARSAGSPSENLMISEQGAAWSSPGYDIKYSKDQCNGNDYGYCK